MQKMKNLATYTAADVRPKTQTVIGNNGDVFNFVAAIYEAMGDETRLKVLYIIDREKSVSRDEICRILKTDGINIDKDLKLLVDLKLVSCVKYKQQLIYALNSERKEFVLPLLDKVKTHISMKKLYEMEEFALLMRKAN
jgi:DNA-binding transcriptional ArsR family regulator